MATKVGLRQISVTHADPENPVSIGAIIVGVSSKQAEL